LEVNVVGSGGPGCNQFQPGQGCQPVVADARVDGRREYFALLGAGQVGGMKENLGQIPSRIQNYWFE